MSRRRVAPGATRVVLVMDRAAAVEDQPLVLSLALDHIAKLKYELVGVMDPKDFRAAHRMIADDLADILILMRREHLPSVAALPWDMNADRRTARLYRPEMAMVPADAESPRDRRSQLVARPVPAADQPSEAGQLPAPQPEPVRSPQRRPQPVDRGDQRAAGFSDGPGRRTQRIYRAS